MIGIEAQREWSAERKGTEIEIQTGFKKRARERIKVTEKLVVKEAIREKLARENRIMNVTAPSGDIVRERHVGTLAGFRRKGRTVIK
jgi:hypothetical protein